MPLIRAKNIAPKLDCRAVFLYKLETKIQTLLSYYLPSSKVVKSSDDLSLYKYIITSDSDFISYNEQVSKFKLINVFENNYLLVNNSKL